VAETRITKSLTVKGNIAMVYDAVSKKMATLDYTRSSYDWPTDIEFRRGTGGMLARSIREVKTVLTVNLDQAADKVQVSFEYVLNIPSSYLSKGDNEIEKEFADVEQELVLPTTPKKTTVDPTIQVSVPKFCGTCGSATVAGKKFCMNCGEPLEVVQTKSVSAPSQTTSMPEPTNFENIPAKQISPQKEIPTEPKPSSPTIELDQEKSSESESSLQQQLESYKKQYQQQDELALNLMDQMKTNLIQLDRFFNNLMSEKNIAINRAYLDQIKDFQTTSKSLFRIMSNLADLQRLDLNRLTISKGAHNLGTIIQDTISEIKQQPQSAGKIIDVTIEEYLTCSCDKGRISQVIQNIVQNAVYFSHENDGQIFVTLEQEDGNARIRIKDNGIGIRKENLKRIFDRFFQSDHPLAQKYPGAGLGLSLCKALIEKHDGKIWAESLGLETGAAINILLPLQTTTSSPTIRKIE